MAFQITLVLLILALIWLGVLTYFFQKLRSNYLVLMDGVNRRRLDDVLSSIMKEQNISKREIAKLIARCDTIEKNELLHIQKIGLLRFNPFKDTGGDQSFILSLIDAHDTGVVITALYSRSGTRWYAKNVVKGKGIEHNLSEEEQKALKVAKQVDA